MELLTKQEQEGFLQNGFFNEFIKKFQKGSNTNRNEQIKQIEQQDPEHLATRLPLAISKSAHQQRADLVPYAQSNSNKDQSLPVVPDPELSFDSLISKARQVNRA